MRLMGPLGRVSLLVVAVLLALVAVLAQEDAAQELAHHVEEVLEAVPDAVRKYAHSAGEEGGVGVLSELEGALSASEEEETTSETEGSSSGSESEGDAGSDSDLDLVESSDEEEGEPKKLSVLKRLSPLRLVKKIGRQISRLLNKYNQLLENHYHLMSFVQGTFLGVLGDIFAQMIEVAVGKIPGPFAINPERTFHITILAMLIDGILTPRYYDMLEKVSSKKDFRTIAAKVVTGSLVYGPVANGGFLAGVALFRDKFTKFDFVNWRRQLYHVTLRDIQMWPAFDTLNFLFIHPLYRPLAVSFMILIFNIVICLTAQTDFTEHGGAAPAKASSPVNHQLGLLM